MTGKSNFSIINRNGDTEEHVLSEAIARMSFISLKYFSSCFEYKNFGIKEVDLAEIGAESLSLLPKMQTGEHRSCGQRSEARERPLKVLTEDYFWGVKDDVAFFTSADSRDGFSLFTAIDGRTGRVLARRSYADVPSKLDFKISSRAGVLELVFKTEIRGGY